MTLMWPLRKVSIRLFQLPSTQGTFELRGVRKNGGVRIQGDEKTSVLRCHQPGSAYDPGAGEQMH